MKRVGIVSFFPAFEPPSSGGELRLNKIARHLAESFDVQMAAPTYGHVPFEEVPHGDRFLERRFPRTKAHHYWHGVLGRAAKFSECSGLVCSLVGGKHVELAREVDRLSRECDILTHESPFLQPLAPRRGHDRQLFVYNSYNVEAYLARDMFGRGLWGRWAARRVAGLERALVREADLVFVCSDEDAEGLVAMYGADRSKMEVVPNGVDIEAIKPPESAEARAEARSRLGLGTRDHACVFLGSFHPPNVESVHHIATRLAPALPHAIFLVAGKVCQAFDPGSVPGNVRLLGLVSEQTKGDLLHGGDVALNPMFSGSGTNLKMLDYLAAGLPCVSTTFGARGLSLEHHVHALLADGPAMLRAIEDVLGDSSLRARLAVGGRHHVERNFSWRAIGQRVADIYTLKTGRRRVLVLNDYAVTPADAGGKIRIDAVARGLASAGSDVTILTLTGEAQGRRIAVADRCEELNVPKAPMHRRMDAVLAHALKCSADDVSSLLLTRTMTPRFAAALRREARFASAVLFSHCYLEPLRKELPAGVDVFYDAHNVEYEMKRVLFPQTRLARFAIERVKRAEGTLARNSRHTFCVSEATKAALLAMAPESAAERIHVVPNGTDCSQMMNLSREERQQRRLAIGLGPEPTAVFLGSGHPPNAQAARLIIDEAAQENPGVSFLLIGSVCGWFVGQALPQNVVMMSTVSNSVKSFLLQCADLALNPMQVGSGTSLKLFDYLAAGLPVLTTRLGARGIAPEDEPVLFYAEVEEFSRRLREIAAEPELLERHREASRRLALEKFDWPVALRPMVRTLAAP